MMFGVVVDQLLFTKCLFVSFFWLNLRNSSVFFGCCLICLVKNGNRELQGELGFPFIWHCFANASCHMFASPISRSKRTLLKGKPRGGKTCGPGDTRNMVSDGDVPSIQPLKGLILVSYEPFRMLRHS